MTNKQIEAIKKDLHPRAEKIAKNLIKDFATSLLLQAKILAYQQGADVVLSNHIYEAFRINSVKQKQTWVKEFAVVIGGVSLGAFIQGFIIGISKDNALLISVYTVLGFFGVLLVFWGLQR